MATKVQMQANKLMFLSMLEKKIDSQNVDSAMEGEYFTVTSMQVWLENPENNIKEKWVWNSKIGEFVYEEAQR